MGAAVPRHDAQRHRRLCEVRHQARVLRQHLHVPGHDHAADRVDGLRAERPQGQGARRDRDDAAGRDERREGRGRRLPGAGVLRPGKDQEPDQLAGLRPDQGGQAAARPRQRADPPVPDLDAGRQPRHGPDRQHAGRLRPDLAPPHRPAPPHLRRAGPGGRGGHRTPHPVHRAAPRLLPSRRTLRRTLGEVQELLPRYRGDNIFDTAKFATRFPDFTVTSYREGITEILR